eukprot:gene34709-46596_t
MIQLLEKSLSEEKIGLIQSVIRINHIEAKYTHRTVRKIWSTFAKSITLVKKFVLLRSELNVFECAILLDSLWKKSIALSVAAAQIFSYAALASYIYNDQCAEDLSGWNCFWRTPIAIFIALLYAFLTGAKCSSIVTFSVYLGYMSVVVACFVLIIRTDQLLDIILNALAVASISELDEELGSILDDGGNVVEEFFKAKHGPPVSGNRQR